jgi:hypothetical protein
LAEITVGVEIEKKFVFPDFGDPSWNQWGGGWPKCGE